KLLYAANFTAGRVETLSLASNSLVSPIVVPALPTALAVSPDNRYLVVGHYSDSTPSSGSGLTIVNLEDGTERFASMGADSVLTVSFGNSSHALIVTTAGV